MLVQGIPTLPVSQMVKIIKSIMAREIFKQYPYIKKEIPWGGNLWTRGYDANTVGMYASRDTIEKYIRNQGKDPEKDYKKLYEGQLGLDFGESQPKSIYEMNLILRVLTRGGSFRREQAYILARPQAPSLRSSSSESLLSCPCPQTSSWPSSVTCYHLI